MFVLNLWYRVKLEFRLTYTEIPRARGSAVEPTPEGSEFDAQIEPDDDAVLGVVGNLAGPEVLQIALEHSIRVQAPAVVTTDGVFVVNCGAKCLLGRP